MCWCHVPSHRRPQSVPLACDVDSQPLALSFERQSPPTFRAALLAVAPLAGFSPGELAPFLEAAELAALEGFAALVSKTSTWRCAPGALGSAAQRWPSSGLRPAASPTARATGSAG